MTTITTYYPCRFISNRVATTVRHTYFLWCLHVVLRGIPQESVIGLEIHILHTGRSIRDNDMFTLVIHLSTDSVCSPIW
jgi:hypothetical protein